MKQRLTKTYGGYGQRWQVETAFSMIKRRSATAVQGRSYWSQCRDLWLLTLTHNLMILYVLPGFLQSSCVPFSSSPDRFCIGRCTAYLPSCLWSVFLFPYSFLK